jgi:hypothetical protein
VSGDSDPVNDEVSIPCLHVPSPRQPSARAAAASVAESDDEVPMSRIPPRSALASCDGDDEVLIPRPILSCPASTSRPCHGVSSLVSCSNSLLYNNSLVLVEQCRVDARIKLRCWRKSSSPDTQGVARGLHS